MGVPASAQVDALPLLLTVESFLFASFGLALTVMGSTSLAYRSLSEARALSIAIAVLMTAVATGAAFAWHRTFIGAWPDRLDEQVPALAIALGVAAQPLIAGFVSWLLVRKPARTPETRR